MVTMLFSEHWTRVLFTLNRKTGDAVWNKKIADYKLDIHAAAPLL